ncbi:SpoIIE family protein phosphatase [Phytomonospora sp. NPDC050363]|uniref:SpoIIE family protein phosphatase n=1 Tax=Phytomonospora sp. NPDC050363 TaxID=3155642 RepID=UPI003404EB05
MTESVEPSGDALETLSNTVAKLRKERDGLRRAMRNRAVIEQAKGILSERLSVSPEDAFAQLIELSTHSNVKLAELAAALVAGRTPGLDSVDAPEVAGAEVLTRFPQPTNEVSGYAADLAENLAEPTARHRLLAGRIESALTFDEIAEAVAASTLGWPTPATAVLMLLDVDGALRLAGASGLPTEARSQWSRVPPIEGLPMVEAVRLRRAVLITDPETLRTEFPTTVAPNSTQGLVALPLIADGSVLGVLELFWEQKVTLDDDGYTYLLGLAGPVSQRCAHLAAIDVFGGRDDEAGGNASVLPLVLDALAEPVVLLAPIYGDDDQIVDFQVQASSGPARDLAAGEDLGDSAGSLITFLPRLGSQRLVPWLTEVAESGEQRVLKGVYVDAAIEGTRGTYSVDLHATRLWDRVLVTGKVHQDSDLLYDQLLLSEEATGTGSFRWDLNTGQTLWSPGMYRLVGRDPGQGPLPTAEVGELIDPADLQALVAEIDETLVKGLPLSVQVRGAGPVKGRHFLLEVVAIQEDGALVCVTGTCLDITDSSALAARLKKSQGDVAAGQVQLDSRDSLLDVLSAPAARLDLPGFAIRGLITGPATPVLNCWYDNVELPDGRVLLIVGEVHGADAAAACQRLRHAAVAYGLAGLTPGALLTALNTLSARLESGRTAAITVVVVDAAAKTAAWAAAGQGALIRCSAGAAGQVIPGALGLPVGSADGLVYNDNEAALRTGDRLVLFTDGVINGDGVNPAVALGALLSCEHSEPAEILDDLRERSGAGRGRELCLVAGVVTE